MHQLEAALLPIVHNEFHRGIFVWEMLNLWVTLKSGGFFWVEPMVTGFLAELLGSGSFHL